MRLSPYGVAKSEPNSENKRKMEKTLDNFSGSFSAPIYLRYLVEVLYADFFYNLPKEI